MTTMSDSRGGPTGPRQVRKRAGNFAQDLDLATATLTIENTIGSGEGAHGAAHLLGSKNLGWISDKVGAGVATSSDLEKLHQIAIRLVTFTSANLQYAKRKERQGAKDATSPRRAILHGSGSAGHHHEQHGWVKQQALAGPLVESPAAQGADHFYPRGGAAGSPTARLQEHARGLLTRRQSLPASSKGGMERVSFSPSSRRSQSGGPKAAPRKTAGPPGSAAPRSTVGSKITSSQSPSSGATQPRSLEELRTDPKKGASPNARRGGSVVDYSSYGLKKSVIAVHNRRTDFSNPELTFQPLVRTSPLHTKVVSGKDWLDLQRDNHLKRMEERKRLREEENRIFEEQLNEQANMKHITEASVMIIGDNHTSIEAQTQNWIEKELERRKNDAAMLEKQKIEEEQEQKRERMLQPTEAIEAHYEDFFRRQVEDLVARKQKLEGAQQAQEATMRVECTFKPRVSGPVLPKYLRRRIEEQRGHPPEPLAAPDANGLPHYAQATSVYRIHQKEHEPDILRSYVDHLDRRVIAKEAQERIRRTAQEARDREEAEHRAAQAAARQAAEVAEREAAESRAAAERAMQEKEQSYAIRLLRASGSEHDISPGNVNDELLGERTPSSRSSNKKESKKGKKDKKSSSRAPSRGGSDSDGDGKKKKRKRERNTDPNSLGPPSSGGEDLASGASDAEGRNRSSKKDKKEKKKKDEKNSPRERGSEQDVDEKKKKKKESSDKKARKSDDKSDAEESPSSSRKRRAEGEASDVPPSSAGEDTTPRSSKKDKKEKKEKDKKEAKAPSRPLLSVEGAPRPRDASALSDSSAPPSGSDAEGSDRRKSKKDRKEKKGKDKKEDKKMKSPRKASDVEESPKNVEEREKRSKASIHGADRESHVFTVEEIMSSMKAAASTTRTSGGSVPGGGMFSSAGSLSFRNYNNSSLRGSPAPSSIRDRGSSAVVDVKPATRTHVKNTAFTAVTGFSSGSGVPMTGNVVSSNSGSPGTSSLEHTPRAPGGMVAFGSSPKISSVDLRGGASSSSNTTPRSGLLTSTASPRGGPPPPQHREQFAPESPPPPVNAADPEHASPPLGAQIDRESPEQQRPAGLSPEQQRPHEENI
ncbi:unnamed protein product [Amoebophrya sp. A25]|nr:unnamed protein product [Amoebophrya sp. A25]|eukprot:GSA25T00016532001.1